MSPFGGFSKEIFESCEPSEKIKIPISSLKKLKFVIEPKLNRLNPNLIGHVSRTKIPGTNYYNDWAWLYFNTIGPGAYRYSQLTINLSPSRVYVGVNLRRPSENTRFRNAIKKEENAWLLEHIVRTLGGREWVISTREDWWEEQEPRRYSQEELRGLLFDPELYWINACYEKDNPIVNTSRISSEILQIFNELYNIYALASDNVVIQQPKPAEKVYEPRIRVDSIETLPKSDEEIRSNVGHFLSSLETPKSPSERHLPGKRDQIIVKTIAIERNLRRHEIDYEGHRIVIYFDKGTRLLRPENLENHSEFSQQVDYITKTLNLPEDFLKIMYVDSKSDARYSKAKGVSSIFLNLARFEMNKNPFFWFFAVARELSYIKIPRLGYAFINLLRDILMIAMENKKRMNCEFSRTNKG